jgi:AraC-like DNA-binding protein/CheY-like chemotaxis protein
VTSGVTVTGNHPTPPNKPPGRAPPRFAWILCRTFFTSWRLPVVATGCLLLRLTSRWSLLRVALLDSRLSVRAESSVKLEIVEGSRPGVLVVDDEPLVRSFLRATLEPIVRFHEAADAEGAFELLRQRARAIDVVIVDQVLPGRSGLEILQITKHNWPWIPIALLTGFGSEDLAVQALRCGASDYLRKPIGVTALRETVTRLMTRRGDPVPKAITPASAGGTENDSRPVHPNIRRALAFMSEHFTEAISLADAAREAGLSRFHFCRLFHHEMGVPFHEHLHDLRVRTAKTLLTDRYMRVSEVAYAVGFNDLSHFDRTFRKIVGRSPSEYRASFQCA